MGFNLFLSTVLATVSVIAWADEPSVLPVANKTKSSRPARVRASARNMMEIAVPPANIDPQYGPYYLAHPELMNEVVETVGPAWACNLSIEKRRKVDEIGLPVLAIQRRWVAEGVVRCSTPQGESAHRVLLTVTRTGIMAGNDDGIATMNFLTTEIGISGWEYLNDTFTLGPSIRAIPGFAAAEIGAGLKIRRFDSGLSLAGILEFGEGHGLGLELLVGTEITIQDSGPLE